MTRKKRPRRKPESRSDKVQRLRDAIRDGRYETDASKLADRLIASGVLSSNGTDPDDEEDGAS